MQSRYVLNYVKCCINTVNFLDLPVLKILLIEVALISFFPETITLHKHGLNANAIA